MGTIASILKQLIYTLAVAVYRLASLFVRNTNLHTARFARLHELTDLLSTSLEPDTSLLLGVRRLDHVLRVQPSSTRRELGNLLVAAPTRGGKGLLAVSQLLTWRHSVVVNDIKGEPFSQTAGFRTTLGPVFVFDPTGVGHRYDPLASRATEDELLSSATHLLFKADEGDGAIFTQRAAVMLTQLLLAARGDSPTSICPRNHPFRSARSCREAPGHIA